MLQLKDIVKTYKTGDTEVQALKGVSINFRPNEFVSILGQSGCGKTTLLNIVGGLDQYTSGDLVIKGKSTKQYKDRDWDAYRNHSIGFVFQSYNLIMHQSVLQNVELALTLSGVSKADRRRRAKEVLEKVGLGDQMKKKPNQMSGGQMQRVAIARALINDPEILLADEPTGALDTETSVQIMELLKEIAKDRLVVMVTHNPDLANEYSTRIVKLLDGVVIDDSNPYTDEEIEKEQYEELDHKSLKHKRMSYLTALNLSFNNLLTKKGRTILTAFAGSIGIIGIALILSLSDGFRNYIKGVEEDTLSTYPLEITDETVDSTAMMTAMMGNVQPSEDKHDMDKIYSNDFVGSYINTLMGEVKINDMKSFKKYIEEGDGQKIKDYTSDIKYTYGIEVNAYQIKDNNEIFQANPSTVLDSIGMGSFSDMASMSVGSGNMSMNLWSQMIGNQEMLENQYDVIAGEWPDSYDELVLVVSEFNEITDYELYALGLRDVSELQQMVTASIMGGTKEFESTSYTYEELLNVRYKVIPSSDFYAYDEAAGCYVDKSDDANYMREKIENGVEVRISAIVRPSDRATVHSINTTIGYRKDLVDYLMAEAKESEVGKEQLENPDINVFTGYEFGTDLNEAAMEEAEESSQEMYEQMGIADMSNEELAMMMSNMSAEEIAAMIDAMEQSTADMMSSISLNDLKTVEDATYEENLISLGIAFEDDPMVISMYPIDFESKELIMDIIDDYNQSVMDAGEEEKELTYTDMIGTMMSSISSIINSISYVLMAFVAISLVVSSIMIGIITYISVLERTKEIGILRSIGASKKDISRVFNAETIIVGFVAGLLGIIVTILLNIPVNKIIEHFSDLKDVAKLPVAGAIILIIISVVLTMIAGLLPSRVASKKDPVEALRSE
ncbi:MAG: ABC transporter ATP-binding protein/permease [Clostridium sp.]|nr:ABC transporter ATP-binding protein/permease [Clostridium sp.]MCM1173253.1 ABC transporter ATP-binding protein/permease [Clostridium sp.]MCM1208345.1 ABC transporter ATP-binding protein/permease [Ruminococcus sp.]